MGLPNAGKTTYSAQYDNVIHRDDFGGKNKYERIIELVKKNSDVCVEGVYLFAARRKDLVAASNTKNTCIWLDTSPDLCRQREREGRNRWPGIINEAERLLEPPTYDEGWDEIIRIIIK